MKYYLDEKGKIHEKKGMDFRVSKGLHNGKGLTEVDQAYVDALAEEASKTAAAQLEYNWAKSELESSDIEIKYHERNSKRAKLTVEQWYEYQEQLRDYASVDVNGDYSTEGDRPIRPS